MSSADTDVRRDEIVDDRFGHQVADPYRWLERADAPEVQAWMAQQDAQARSYLTQLPHRDALRARLRELLYYDSISPPVRRGDRLFYTRRHHDREKSIVYWREQTGDEQVLFDPNTMSADGSLSLGVWVPSWDGARVAYALRENNADEATLYVRDVATGKDLPTDRIPGAKYATPSWTPDGSGFYYTWLPVDSSIPVAERPGHAEVRFHRLGANPTDDEVVHPATGSARTFIGATLSRDGRFLLVTISHGWNSTDVFVQDLHAGTPLRPLVSGTDSVYYAGAWQGRLYLHTNEQAPRYRLFAVDPEALEREHWRELVAEREDFTIEQVQVIGDHLIVTGLRDAASAVEVRTLDGTLVRQLALPGIGTVEGLVGDPDQDEAYYVYSSFVDPPQIYRTEICSGATELWNRVELPLDASRFTVERVWYPSADGTQISMFLIRRTDLKRDGSNPTILYGYGGFNISLTPAFGPSVAAWLERGGLYAVANLRGGGEYGEQWHRDGMLHHKQNVFDDFLAAADYLVAQGYTTAEQLAIRGGSNGGLLVGAAMTQRPDLCRAVVCAVPLLDMLRYHLFGSGETWTPEYGSPETEAEFRTLLAYSPYHRVVHGTAYPAMLMLSADSDDRVDPVHARKFTAAIQHASTSGLPTLIRIERNAGHGGADMVAHQVDQAADTYAFLLAQLTSQP